MDKGWIKLHRKLKEHWLWEEERKFSKVEAWISLLMDANHNKKRLVKNMSIVEVERGQVLTSQLKLAKQWQWNPKTVRRFLQLLKKDEMIRYETVSGGDSGYTLITILNYNKLQSKLGSGRDNEMVDERTSKEERVPINNNINKNNKNKEENKDTVCFSFEELWNKYPRKVGKKLSGGHFKDSVRNQEDWDSINKAFNNYINSSRVREGFIKDGSNWFKEWRDWINYFEVPKKKDLNEQERKKREEADEEEFKKEEARKIAEAKACFA